MKIAMISLAYDPAGVGQMLTEAINTHTKHTCNHIIPTGASITERDKMTNRHNIFMTPVNELQSMINDADVIHIHQIHPFQDKEVGPASKQCGVKWTEVLSKKPWVFHNHGGAFLINPNKFMEHIGKFNPTLLMCSPLSKYIFPDSAYLPNLCPINSDNYKPTDRDFTKTMKVCHKIWYPSTKMYKGTEVLEEVFDLLKKDGFRIDFKVFHSMNIDKCLKDSADYHVCVDNITQGFIGMSGWESLAKGQVVIARLDPLVYLAYKKIGNGEAPPIINVSGMDELAAVMRDLDSDRTKLKRLCEESRSWMEKHYNEKKITQIYVDFYQSLIDGDYTPEQIEKMELMSMAEEPKAQYTADAKDFDGDISRESFENLPNMNEATKSDGLMGSSMYNTYEIEKIDEFWKEVGLINNKKFLDLGCGIGRLTPTILKSKPKSYVGVDFSSTMVKEFMQNFPALQCYSQDLADLNQIPDKSADTSFIMYVLIHIIDRQKGVLNGKPVIDQKLKRAVEEIKRVTKEHIVIGQDMTIPKDFQEKVDGNICRFLPKDKLVELFHPWKLKYYLENYYQLYSPYDNDLDSKISFVVFENPEGVKPLPTMFKGDKK